MLKLSKSALQRSHDDLESNLKGARSEVVSLKATVSQMAADASAIQCQLGATKVGRVWYTCTCRWVECGRWTGFSGLVECSWWVACGRWAGCSTVYMYVCTGSSCSTQHHTYI